jgi:hypothetical protein
MTREYIARLNVSKFYVVLFRLFEGGDRFRETGGGVVFVPEGRTEAWQSAVAALVKANFRHPLGPCVELGFATLDKGLLERHCQRYGELYWQGGDG